MKIGMCKLSKTKRCPHSVKKIRYIFTEKKSNYEYAPYCTYTHRFIYDLKHKCPLKGVTN